jgi:hypothetical protein
MSISYSYIRVTKFDYIQSIYRLYKDDIWYIRVTYYLQQKFTIFKKFVIAYMIYAICEPQTSYIKDYYKLPTNLTYGLHTLAGYIQIT